jgi:Zn-dependent protease
MDGQGLNWWVAEMWQISPVLLVSWVVWVIGSIVLHELGHGWAALRAGDPTPRETGHMTWNPLVHMGRTSLIMFAVTGITWGLMPVNPSRFRHPYDFAKVAFAGPAMNLSLALTSLVLSGVWIAAAGGYWFEAPTVNANLFQNVQLFLRVGVAVNLFGFIFNLLPIPPLDGSTIARTLIPSYARAMNHEQAPMVMMAMFAILFFWGSQYIFDGAFEVSMAAIGRVAELMTGGRVQHHG